MTLVDRSVRRQFTAAMALAMALALLLSGTALAQTKEAVDIAPACEDAPDSDFPDTAGNTFEDEIDCLAWYEVTIGTNEGTYEPFRKVTRWQMALFIYRVAQYMDPFVDPNLPEPAGSNFEDIDGVDEEAQAAIDVLTQIDVVKGKDATTYAPGEVVRRDQMASFINRLQEWATGSTHAGPGENDASGAAYGYPDVPIDNVHGTNIEDLTAAGIVQGKTNGNYAPAEGVNRGQMSAFITRDLAVNVTLGVIEPKTGDELNLDGRVGVVTDASVAAEYTFVENGTDEEVTVEYSADDTFYIDGDAASHDAFEAALDEGDVIEWVEATDDEDAIHSLTNTEVESGFIGDLDLGDDTIDIINTVSGDVLEQFDYTGDLFTVDGDTATVDDFELALNEGDTVVIDDPDDDDDGDPVETYHLTNGTLSGSVSDFDKTTDVVDVELSAGAVVSDIAFAGADSYMVDGDTSNAATFEADLTVGDSVTWEIDSDGVVSWTLVNMAQTTQSGLAVEDDLVDDEFRIVDEDGETTVDYDATTLPDGLENRFFIDGELVTETEFEAAGEYTPGDSVSFTDANDGEDQDRVIALTNEKLRGEIADVQAVANTVDVLGPDGATELVDNEAYIPLTDDLQVNGDDVDEATFEAALIAVEAGLIDGVLEVDYDEDPVVFNVIIEN